MSSADDLAVVIELACQIVDRSPAEQSALLRVACRLDVSRARHTVTNPDPIWPYLVEMVVESYDPHDVPVKTPGVLMERVERVKERWGK